MPNLEKRKTLRAFELVDLDDLVSRGRIVKLFQMSFQLSTTSAASKGSSAIQRSRSSKNLLE